MFFIVSTQGQVASTPSMKGIWQGSLKIFGTELRIVFKISKNSNGTLIATLDNPDQKYAIKEIPNLNHMFQTAQTATPAEYAKIKETISPVA